MLDDSRLRQPLPRQALFSGQRLELGPTSPMLSGQSAAYSLTAPGAMAQDTEKAVVFHYSKVKDDSPRASTFGVTFGQMLHYYIIGLCLTDTVVGDGRDGRHKACEYGTHRMQESHRAPDRGARRGLWSGHVNMAGALATLVLMVLAVASPATAQTAPAPVTAPANSSPMTSSPMTSSPGLQVQGLQVQGLQVR